MIHVYNNYMFYISCIIILKLSDSIDSLMFVIKYHYCDNGSKNCCVVIVSTCHCACTCLSTMVTPVLNYNTVIGGCYSVLY